MVDPCKNPKILFCFTLFTGSTTRYTSFMLADSEAKQTVFNFAGLVVHLGNTTGLKLRKAKSKRHRESARDTGSDMTGETGK